MTKSAKQGHGQKIRERKAHGRKQGEPARKILTLPVMDPDTAGVDIGALQIHVAVPADRSETPVRTFGSFTRDLQEIVAWLKECRIGSVAMESTGVYWLPLYQLLADHEFNVCLVNARHYKNVPGKKTDVADCQWLQFLHSVGLLRGSHRPEQAICALRSLWRHRCDLIGMAAQHVQVMQKSLEQMNLKLHHVISDLTGVTGMAIVEAILSGQRNLEELADLRHGTIKASKEEIMKSLEGDYRREHLFTLQQSLNLYRMYQRTIAELDQEIESELRVLPGKMELHNQPLPAGKKKRQKSKNAPAFDLRTHCYRMLGVDLTEVPALDANTAYLVLTEVNFAAFPSAAAFTSWLRLCPCNEISGGRVLSVRTRKGKNRVALALRTVAQTLHASKSALGDYFRRMRAKFGPVKAITAAAHKLARIIYHMVTTGDAYNESALAKQDTKRRKRQTINLRKQASALGFQLVPIQTLDTASANVPA